MFFWKGKSMSLPLNRMNERFSTVRTSAPGMRRASQASISGWRKWKKWPE